MPLAPVPPPSHPILIIPQRLFPNCTRNGLAIMVIAEDSQDCDWRCTVTTFFFCSCTKPLQLVKTTLDSEGDCWGWFTSTLVLLMCESIDLSKLVLNYQQVSICALVHPLLLTMLQASLYKTRFEAIAQVDGAESLTARYFAVSSCMTSSALFTGTCMRKVQTLASLLGCLGQTQ